ncbi:hypothetical protein V8C26DRAFT_413894 [Trichoderma gracile]
MTSFFRLPCSHFFGILPHIVLMMALCFLDWRLEQGGWVLLLSTCWSSEHLLCAAFGLMHV